MTNEQYRQCLADLNLTPASQRTARALGVSVRQAQRFHAGFAPIPEPIALLLRVYIDHPTLIHPSAQPAGSVAAPG